MQGRPSPTSRPAVFLDRDGVINCKAPEGDYVKTPAELELLPGVARAIADLREAGYLVLVVSNQRGVARGLMTEDDLEAVTAAMMGPLVAEGGAPDGVYYCIHGKEVGCPCRKPRPGLLLAAAEDRAVDLERSWMVGDRESDVVAGRAAGCRTILVGGAEGTADVHADDLEEAVGRILDLG